jgi:hypothetical protein
MPPNWEHAEDHLKARRVGPEADLDNPHPSVCDCCGYKVEREELPISCDP